MAVGALCRYVVEQSSIIPKELQTSKFSIFTMYVERALVVGRRKRERETHFFHHAY